MPSSSATLASWSSTIRIRAFENVGSADHVMSLRFAVPTPRVRKFQRHVQRLHEFIDFDRLGEIAEEPGLEPFSMSRGMALALRAITGMWAVDGSSRRISGLRSR